MDLTEETFSRRRLWARVVTVLVAIVVVASALAVAGVILTRTVTASGGLPPTASSGGRHAMYIGTVDLQVQTTNPLQYTLVDEYYILAGVYSFLINYGPNWEQEPDLAVSWAQTSSSPSVWEFHLAHNAYFVDPRDCTRDAGGYITGCPTNHPVTAQDVKFTFDYVKKNRNGTSYYVTLVEDIDRVELSSDPYFVRIVFDKAYAPAMATFTGVPILPQYIWSPGGSDVAVDWTNALPIGSGPYLVRNSGSGFAMVTPPPLIFDRNPIWHGPEVQGRQVFSDTMFYESYTTSAAMAVDLTLGKLDYILGPSPQDYTTFLAGKAGIMRQSLYDGFEAEQAVNVLPNDLRSYFSSISRRPVNLGNTNPILMDQTVRTAIHMVTDRQKMINNALVGLGTPGDTLFPSSVPTRYAMPPYSADDKNDDGNPYDFPPFTDLALEQFPDGPAAIPMARTILVQAGWAYDCTTGATQNGLTVPLCKKDLGTGKTYDALTFRYSTLNTEPWWETAARGVIEDAAKAGIQFNLELLNSAQMTNLWNRLDYDVWLWDWVWTPITDISTFMVVQTCKGVVTLDNDNGFCLKDPVTGHWTFDDLYNQTLTQTDAAARQALSDLMNKIIYGYASYNLPFYRAELYAMNEVRWTNWVNFNDYRAVPPDAGNSPILGQVVYPVSDKPPQFTLSNFEGVVGQPVQFSVAAVDPQGGTLRYRWDFDTSVEVGGAGVNGDSIPFNDDQGGNTPTPTATYNSPGTYGIALRVSQDGGDFFTVHRAQVTIRAAGTGAPRITGLSISPSDPTSYAGDLTTLAASATDPAGLAITEYSWNWGDGSPVTVTAIPTASHQYASPNTYTAELTVKNSADVTATSSTIVPVVANSAPVIAQLQDQAVLVSANNTFVAFASDLNARDILTYSWSFGDGGVASGNPVYHTYTTQNAQYTMTVTVSDGHGHAPTSSATINVVADRNTAPKINTFTATPSTAYTTLPVTFKANVTDDQGNALLWQWDFNGDNVVDKQYTTPLSTPGMPQIRTEVYQFSTTGTNIHSKLTITDQPATGNPKSVSTTVTVKIYANTAPTLTDLTLAPSIGIAGEEFTIASTSNDANGDRLTYTWDNGDGTSSTGLTPYFGGPLSTKHSFAAAGSYVVVLTVNDGKGGEARKSALVTVSPGGLLRVTTSVDIHPTWGVWSQVLVDGIPRDEWGLAWMKIAPGQHTVSWTGSPGLATPAAQVVDVVEGQTTVVNGEFRARGFLRVTQGLSPVAGTVFVNDVPMDDWGVWLAVDPGQYKVSWGPVAGFDPPTTQYVDVYAEQLATVVGDYVANAQAPGPDPATYGLLRVTTSVDIHPTWGVWSQVLVDGIPRDEWGLAWLKIAPGSHTISWTDSPGLATPTPVVANVVAGQTTNVNGEFKAEGFLRVTQGVPSVPGTVFVNGIPRNDWGMWMAMPPGTYTVSWGPVEGMVTPASEVATVTAETSYTVTGTYAPIGEGPLVIAAPSLATTPEVSAGSSSLAASAPATVRGPATLGMSVVPMRREEAV